MRKTGVFICIIMVWISCTKKPIEITEIAFQHGVNNLAPSLVAQEGKLSLSWIQSAKKGQAKLYYSELENYNWKTPTTITFGNDWFVNWADFPTNAINKNVLLTSYLKKSAKGTYTYDVILNLQKINGEVIKKDFLLHTDGTKAEHGFVSIIPSNNDGFIITWLDGRNTVLEVKEKHHKAMTIRVAEVSKDGIIANEKELDNRTCDCCQTSIAMTQDGPMIVFRDRSKKEIRDIYFSKQKNGVWSKPAPVYRDNWKINGCPVNGPKIVSNKKNTAVAWFTLEKEIPKVKVSFFTGKGFFAEPIVLNDLDAIGRVDVAFINSDEVLVSYMESDSNESYLRCKKIAKDGTKSEPITIARINSSRSTGVPQLEVLNGVAYVVWTETIQKEKQLRSVYFSVDGI